MADQYYYESGYIDEKYFVYVADAAVDLTPYIDEGYFDTQGYYEFYGITFSISADLTAQVIIEASASLSSTASIAATISHIHGADLQAFSDAALTSTANIIRGVDSNINSSFSQNTANSRLRDTNISLSTSFELNVVFGNIEQGDSALSSTFTQSADAVVNRSASITLSTIVSLSAQADRTRGISDLVASSGTMVINAAKITDTSSTTSSQFAQSTQAINLRGFNIATNTNFSQNTLAVKTVESIISAGSLFTPSITVSIFKNSFAVLDSVSSTVSSGVVVRSASLSVQSLASLAANVNAIKVGQSTLNVVNSITFVGGFRDTLAANLNSHFAIYTSRYYGRPRNLGAGGGDFTFSTSIYKYGTASLSIPMNGGITTTVGFGEPLTIKASDDFYIEAWLYPISYQDSDFHIFGFGQGFFTGVRVTNRNGYLRLTGAIPDANQPGNATQFYNTGYDTTRLSLSTWHHIAVIKNSTNFSIFRNGTRFARWTATNIGEDILPFGGAWGPANNTTQQIFIGQQGSTARFQIDDVLYNVGSTLGYNPANTTITVPSSQRQIGIDTDSTYIGGYYKFDLETTRFDSVGITQTGAASLSATASITSKLNANPGNIKSNQSATTNISLFGGKLQDVTSYISSQSAVSANISITKQCASSVNTQASVSVSGVVLRQATSSLNTNFSQITINSRTRDNIVQTDSIASSLAAVAKIGDFLIAFDVNATSTVSAVKTTEIISNQTAVTSMLVTAIKTTEAIASLSDSIVQTANSARTRATDVTLSTEFNLLSDSVKTVHVIAALTTNTNLVVENSGLLSGSADLNTAVTISGTVIRNRFANSTIVSEFNLNINAITVLQASSDLQSAVSMNTVNSRTRSTAIQTDSIASQLTAAAKTGQGFITLESAVTISTDAIKTAQGSINLTSTSNLQAAPGTIKLADSAMSSSFAIAAFGVTGVIGESYNSSTSTLTSTAVKTTSILVTAQTNSQLAADIKRTRSTEINLVANAGEVIVGRRIKFAQANLNLNSTLFANGGVNVVILNQTLFNNATLTAAVRAIHIDPYTTWIVAEEDRTRKVSEEIRTRLVEEETRTYIIEGA